MTTPSEPIPPTIPSTHPVKSYLQGTIATLPLIIAVLPWGFLAGSFAIDSGLDVWQSQAMSAIVFAGAAQLVALGMVKAGVGLVSILLTTLLVTSRHLLYCMTLRDRISILPLKWRLSLGFLLTDELFAIANRGDRHHFDRWYALGGGLSFYIAWNIASLVGILTGKTIGNVDEWGLDFTIAATFIALVIPSVNRPSALVCVLVSAVSAVTFNLFEWQAGLLFAALLGMFSGYWYGKLRGEAQ